MLAAMTELVTISLDADQLELARREAERLGISLEAYLSRLVTGGLPSSTPAATANRPNISAIFGIVPASAGEPTDIAKDKDRLIGEAVWKEHLRKTRQTP